VTPAVVVGAGLNGLGMIRSLARHKVPVWLVETSFTDPTALSRYAMRNRVRSLNDVSLVEDLEQLARRLELNPVLILTQEASVQIVSANLHRLQERFLIELPDDAAVRSLTSKRGFDAEARRLGAPIPRTIRISELSHIEAGRNMKFPLILKPDSRAIAYDQRFKKAYRFDDFESLREKVIEILPVYRPLIVQEWIEGDDTSIYFCLQYRSRRLGEAFSFCGRKNRSNPPMVGGTASCTLAEPEAWAPLVKLTNDFFDATCVHGFASMEYKRHASGEFLMIEPTIGRSDFQEEVSTWNGYNIAAAGYAALTGRPLPDVEPPLVPRVWIDPDGEAKSRIVAPATLDLPGDRQDAYWDLFDPMPWVSRQLIRARRRFGILKSA